MPDFTVVDAIMNDGRWRTTVDVTPKGNVSNTDGYATYSEGESVQVDAVIRPADATRYSVVEFGLSNGAEHVMFARADDPVSSGDTVTYRGAEYEVRGLEADPYDGLHIFELVEEVA